MIRIVADTNVYVSAIVFGGPCEAILALARAGVVDLFISSVIQRELQSVLRRSFGWSHGQVRDALSEVGAVASLVRPSVVLHGVVAYPPDRRVLEAALAADADYLITGDKKHLLPLKSFRGIRIVSPRDFLDLLS